MRSNDSRQEASQLRAGEKLLSCLTPSRPLIPSPLLQLWCPKGRAAASNGSGTSPPTPMRCPLRVRESVYGRPGSPRGLTGPAPPHAPCPAGTPRPRPRSTASQPHRTAPHRIGSDQIRPGRARPHGGSCTVPSQPEWPECPHARPLAAASAITLLFPALIGRTSLLALPFPPPRAVIR